VERETGLDFFDRVDDDAEAELEQALGDWPF
jgi:hypothetical protein